MNHAVSLCLAVSMAVLAIQPVLAAPSKEETADQLAELNYRLPVAPSRMVADHRRMKWLANAVERRSAALLKRREITDAAVRRDLFVARRTAALVRGDLAAAAKFDRAAMQSQRLSLEFELLISAIQGERAASGSRNAEVVRQSIRRQLDQRGADQRKQVTALRRELALASSAYRLGEISSFADPEWQRNPVVQQDFATALLRLWVEINLRNSRLEAIESELVGWLNRHPSTAGNIWPHREVEVDPVSAHPVTIAVWDGIDPTVFEKHLRSDAGDPANGIDDDRDGFVDEAEGLAFDERFAPSSGLLMPVPTDLVKLLPDLERYKRGLGELALGLDGPDVAFARAWRRKLTPADVATFERGYGFYANYIHGTEVADVALRGLPKAVLVPVRMTFSSETPGPVLDEEAARRFVVMVDTASRYMRTRGVRVCNISWGFTAQDIADSLRQNGVEADPVKRAKRAREIFATMQQGITQAFAASPNILFVVSAGNASQNIDFAGDLPGTINLPNVLTVGAADEEGGMASFASSGTSVDLYALGTNVESAVPGGGRLRGSGASLAAPQVVNAAARLLSVRPSLSAIDLASLLVRTATPLSGARTRLLHPRAAMELMQDRFPATDAVVSAPSSR